MFSRRRFVKIGATSVGSLALRNFGLLPALAKGVTDYKALVCIFLFGGNDSNNMIIPADPATYEYYKTTRGDLGLSNQNGQLTAAMPSTNGPSYYFHSGLKELAGLFGTGELAVAANVGPLVETTTKSNLGSVPIPNHLFSHSDQQREWQTSDPTELVVPPYGWGGRTSDQLVGNGVNAGNFPPFVSVAGLDILGFGANPQLVLSPGGSLAVRGCATSSPQCTQFNALLQTESGLALAGFSNGIMMNAIQDGQQLAKALASAPAIDLSPFSPANLPAQGPLVAQLQQVAQIINVRENLNMQRQIFFCALGGFDTHQGENETLAKLYPQLSQAMAAFNTVMGNLNLQKSVTVFTESDFSRTFVPSTTDGSDHAWGSHHMVLGGAVKGQTIYGQFPSFQVGGINDYDPSGPSARGRWIPTAPVDQYGYTLVNWLATSQGSTTPAFDPLAVFPNLTPALKRFGPNPLTFL